MKTRPTTVTERPGEGRDPDASAGDFGAPAFAGAFSKNWRAA